MRWKWQKRFSIGYWQCLFTAGQGWGIGLIYHTASLSIWLGPLVIDVTIPTPLWWRIVRQEQERKAALKN